MDKNNNRLASRMKKEKKGIPLKRWNDEFKKIAYQNCKKRSEWKKLGEPYAQNGPGTI